MFRLEESHEFEWPVEIRKPIGVDAEGRPDYERHRITVIFRALPLDAAAEAMDADRDTPRRPLMQQVIVGWTGVLDADGQKLECNAENVARLCRIGYVGAALTDTYFRALTGRTEKN